MIEDKKKNIEHSILSHADTPKSEAARRQL